MRKALASALHFGTMQMVCWQARVLIALLAIAWLCEMMRAFSASS